MAEVVTSDENVRTLIFGIYGIPGAGKTTLLKDLQQVMDPDEISFFEGSAVITKLMSGDLRQFQNLPEAQKQPYREEAINRIRADCMADLKSGVVTGHYMFWSESDEEGRVACTQADLQTYTHIIYLDTPAEVIVERCLSDKLRSRPDPSVEHLQRWQAREKGCTSRALLPKQHLFLGSTL